MTPIPQTSEPEIPIEAFSIFADGLDHPECCAFDRAGNLWAGGEAGQIYRIDSAGVVREIANLGGFTGGIAFSPRDELFVCNPSRGVVRVDRAGKSEVFSDFVAGRKMICPNFPVFDGAGNLYVSDSGDWQGNNGRLVRFDRQGNGIELADGFGYANGLALAEDERHVFMVESDSNSVYRLELLDGGVRVGEREVYAAGAGHVPDGIWFDVDGNLYVTCYASHELYRVTPERQIRLLAKDWNGMLLGGPTNLCFGGPEFDEIFVANLCRRAITRARVGRIGLRPVNLR